MRATLVVIGTRTSHASHELERELDDPDVARAVAARFALERVDADERPDVDARWQPLASPSLEPVWPLVGVADSEGRPLRAAVRLSRATLLRFVDEQNGPPLVKPLETADPSPNIESLVDEIARSAARPFGGFGAPPKHPHAPALALLLGRDATRPLALKTLDAMAQGGIRDQLDGGFHRYATDDRWVVPHFEKRAADQAALLGVYARAFRATGEARYAEVARGVASYVARRLVDAGGGFACAEDCDAGAYDDGSHFTWTVEEARAATDGLVWEVAQRAFDIYGRGELHHDPTRNVLFAAAPPEAIARELGRPDADVRAALDEARAKLLAARDERPRPALDGAVYTDASCALARALVDADAAVGIAWARAHAERTFERAWLPFSCGNLPHRLDTNDSIPLLSDYAQFGLLALALDRRDDGRVIADEAHAQFADSRGAYLDRPRSLERPLRPIRDGALPSPSALMGELLTGVAAASGDERYREHARSLVAAVLPFIGYERVCGAGLVTVACALALP
jgi:uncharacterized protein YyaL (SSP411 family)